MTIQQQMNAIQKHANRNSYKINSWEISKDNTVVYAFMEDGIENWSLTVFGLMNRDYADLLIEKTSVRSYASILN